ncbi:MAG: hypothetical protein Q4G55_11760 [bacterium]|nr:hypothetical protein [bacterium]
MAHAESREEDIEGRRSDCPPWDCRTERSDRAEGPKVEQSAADRSRPAPLYSTPRRAFRA